MSTYPNIKINTAVVDTNTTTYLRSNVLVYGFAARGPANEQTLISSVDMFNNVYGLPDTDAEYAMYTAVKNTIAGGGNALCYRIPYVNKTQYDIAEAVTYYCDASSPSAISSIVDVVDSTDISSNLSSTDGYIAAAFTNMLGASQYAVDTAYNWTLTPISSATHRITLHSKNPTRTIFNTDVSGNVELTTDAKYKSLGIVPVLVGSFNTLFAKDSLAGIQTILKTKLQAAINSTVSLTNIFTDDLLKEYTNLVTANDLYVDCLAMLNSKVSTESMQKNANGLLVFELLLNDNKTITAKLLEYFIGTLNNNITKDRDNLEDVVNKYSNFITMSLLAYDANDDIIFDDNQLWHYVEMPTISNPLYAIGINADAYDANDMHANSYSVHSDDIFGYGSLVDSIEALMHRSFVDNRIYDYVVMPAVVDCFNSLPGQMYLVKRNGGIRYNSGVYCIPNSLDYSTIHEFTYDSSNATSLLNVATKFKSLDSACTVFFDVPLCTLYDLKDIALEQTSDARTSIDVFINMATLALIPVVKASVSNLYANIMFTFNHQYVDKFNETDTYILVPPSSVMLYAYCYADYYRLAVPLAGTDDIAAFFTECHGGLITVREPEIPKLLFNTYHINSLITDLNNNVKPNQQILFNSVGNSIFAQHHAFRVRKYLQRHITSIANTIRYEPNTTSLRHKFVTDVETLLNKYKNTGVITASTVICNDTNNSTTAIDNNEFYCSISVTIFGAVTTINVNITRFGVDIVID